MAWCWNLGAERHEQNPMPSVADNRALEAPLDVTASRVAPDRVAVAPLMLGESLAVRSGHDQAREVPRVALNPVGGGLGRSYEASISDGPGFSCGSEDQEACAEREGAENVGSGHGSDYSAGIPRQQG